jgi:hypothetical protein
MALTEEGLPAGIDDDVLGVDAAGARAEQEH